MIRTIFSLGSEVVEIRIKNNEVLFRTADFGGGFVPIDSIRLDKIGVVKEFPDLKDKENWREEAINRFKINISKMKNEKEKMGYVIEDLAKFGYKPLYLQRSGYRAIKFKE